MQRRDVAKALVKVLNASTVFLAVMTLLVTLIFTWDWCVRLSLRPLYLLDIRDILNNFFLVNLSLAAAVLLTAISLYLETLETRSARGQLIAPSPLAGAPTRAAPAKMEVIPAGAPLEEELKRYKEYLAKLEEFRLSGQVSERAYQTLKGEYTAKIEELKRRMQAN